MRGLNYNKIFVAIFFLGFIIGILYTNLLGADYMRISGGLNEFSLKEFSNQNILLSDYFLHVLWIRICPVLFMGLLAYTKFHQIGALACITWFGYLLGVYISVGILSLGVKGVFFCVISLFPQLLLYLPAYYLILVFVFTFPSLKWNISKIMLIVLCMMCGVVVECNINPVVINWFISIL